MNIENSEVNRILNFLYENSPEYAELLERIVDVWEKRLET